MGCVDVSYRWLGAIVVGVAMAILVFAFALPGNGPRAATAVTLPSRSALEHYSLLRRPVTPEDEIPAVSLVSREPDEGALVRRTDGASSSVVQWGSLEGEELCTILRYTLPDSNDAVDTNRDCDGAGYLESHHELIMGASLVGDAAGTPPEPGVVNVIDGLAPDGISSVTFTFADGSQATVPVVENAFVVRTNWTRYPRPRERPC